LDIINKNLEKARNAEINELDFRVRIFNNGETKNIHMKGEIRASSEGTKIYGVIQDISNIVRAQEQLSKNEAKFRAILSNTSDVVLIYDKDLNLLFNSANEAKILGWTDKELLERDSFTLLHPDDKDMVLDYMDQIITGDIGKNIEFEARVLTKSGEYIYTKNSMLNMIDNPDINGILVNYSDITEIKNREREIAYLSNYDALTGLYNRSYFERSYQEIDEEENMPISIVIGDLNGLKLINDTLGHSKGDEILATMAEIIRSTCKESYLPIRYGGDEYCIVLPNTSSEKAEKYIEKLKEKCREYKESGESEIFYPSIALGCATKETKEQALSSILRIAEDNMYKDKLYEKSSIHNADSLVLSIKAALHEKSFETEEHSARLAKFSTEIGEILGLMDYQLNELSYAAELHDIGKIGVDESILIKAGKLTESEWNKIKEHPEIGYRIAKAAPELNNIAEYILHHHERWDGTGYPFGIAGEDIPLYSRIISVIDAYDVMTSGRPYKAPMSSKEAVRELLENSGSQFDPKIVDIFVNVILL
jgi:diguanylate cyclase (GGDEF)-like protein/PAS domain S-box-containing protein